MFTEEASASTTASGLKIDSSAAAMNSSIEEMNGEFVLKVIKEGVVKKKPKSGGFLNKRAPCRNMILTNQPRLYFTSTLESDGKDGMYKSDIMLFSNLKVSAPSSDVLEIKCVNSGRTYTFNTAEAKLWSEKIKKVVLHR